MKILKINTNLHGGAGIAALRQQQALRARGHDCQMLHLHVDWERQDVAVHEDGTVIRLSVPGLAGSFNSSLAAACITRNRTDISNTWMSFWPDERPFDNHLLRIAAGFDVVHLHWTSHFLSTRSLQGLGALGKRLVFTGHDMNGFTGACHYRAGCEAFVTQCRACPQLQADPLGFVELSAREKMRAAATVPGTWVFPSEWLAAEFRRSAFGAINPDVEVIRNCIEPDVWQPPDAPARQALRSALGVRPEELLLVVGAQNKDEKRKGFEFAEFALRQAQDRMPELTQGRPIVVASFGGGRSELQRESPWLQQLPLGTLGAAELVGLFGAADLLLFPSLEENFSNTILEALLCGCPVLGLRIGGVPEAVHDGVNGRVVDELTPQAYGHALEGLLRPGVLERLRTQTEAWQHQHRADYSPGHVGAQLEALYARAPVPLTAAAAAAAQRPASRLWAAVSRTANRADDRRDSVIHQVQAAVASPGEPGARAHAQPLPLYVGFTAPERTRDMGLVQWVGQHASVHFMARGAPAPQAWRLVLQIAQHPFAEQLWQRAHTDMQVSFDGREAPLQFIAAPQPGGHPYIVAQGAVAAEGPADAEHAFGLSFAALAVELQTDRREVCLLISGCCVHPLGLHEPAQPLTAAECACLLLQARGPSVFARQAPHEGPGGAWIDVLNP